MAFVFRARRPISARHRRSVDRAADRRRAAAHGAPARIPRRHAERGPSPAVSMSAGAPNPDPRVGLKAGLYRCRRGRVEPEAWSRRRSRRRSSSASRTPTSRSRATTRSRAATTATRSGTSRTRPAPTLKTAYFCPASQSDVSVYKNLLFVSGEGLDRPPRLRRAGREGHGQQGAPARHPHLRHHRHRAIRRTSATCRPAAARTRTPCSSIRRIRTTSTSTSPARPRVRSPNELPGCVERDAGQGSELGALPHRSDQGAARASGAGRDRQLAAHLQRPRARRRVTARRRRTSPRRRRSRRRRRARARSPRRFFGEEQVLPPQLRRSRCSTASSKARGGTGAPTAPTARRCAPRFPASSTKMFGAGAPGTDRAGPDAVPRHHGLSGDRPRRRRVRGLRPAARHPAIRRIRCASTPRPIRTSRTGTRRRSTTTAPRSSSPTSGAAAAQPKCRATDPQRVGRRRDLHDRRTASMQFQSYYKLPAPQTRVRELRRAQRLAHSDSRAAT